MECFKCYLSHTKFQPLQPEVRFCSRKRYFIRQKAPSQSPKQLLYVNKTPKGLIQKGTITALLARQCVWTENRGRDGEDHLIKVPRQLYIDKIKSPVYRKSYFYKNRSMFYFNPVEGVRGMENTKCRGEVSLYTHNIRTNYKK